jgi:PAS domain S-box-containing protein
MSIEEENKAYQKRIEHLESKLSELKFEQEETLISLEEEKRQRKFYQLIADFTFGWELWFDPEGGLKFCSPSCFDLTGFTSSQMIDLDDRLEKIVYQLDFEKFNKFLTGSLGQGLINKSLEFRILTRHKQLRWCSLNVRGVYSKSGRYLGIRASINDITNLKQAMGHIYDLSEGKEIENRAKIRFKSELDIKERELVSFLLQLSQKNELINSTTKLLEKIVLGKEKNIHNKLSELMKSLKSTTNSLIDWEMLVLQLENIHPDFLGRLQLKHSKLTLKEKRLCAYLRLGLSSKEVSGLQNITSKSVEIARVRLRKKLKLSSDIRLSKYLDQI